MGFFVNTMIIPLSGGGAYSNLEIQEKEAYLRGELTKKLAVLLEDGSTCQKELRNVLKYQKNEINYMELDVGVIMQKNILKNLLSMDCLFFTESGRILERRGLMKKFTIQRGFYSRGGGAWSDYYDIWMNLLSNSFQTSRLPS